MLLFELAIAKSVLPIPRKSPDVMAWAVLFTVMSLRAMKTPVTPAFTTAKVTGFEVPPPGVGLVTVTVAVPTVAISVARIDAVSFELLTNVVARALPFQLTTDVDTKPVPDTVSVKAAPPGAAKVGTSG